MSYENYQLEIDKDIKNCIETLQVQPILFIGTGMSRRYANAPDWNGLMQYLVDRCPNITKKLAYYQQRYDNDNDNTQIASELSDLYSEWAWSTEPSDNLFPQRLFESHQPKDVYLKHIVAELLKSLSTSFNIDTHPLATEIKALQKIRPHAVITTNYDTLLEDFFADYLKIVGQQIIKANYTCYGEILKIHGCSSDISSMVLTSEDYKRFDTQKKYLSAKLLTYFAEHPLFIFGYSCTDSNIKSILSDIDEIISPNNELIPNIYIVLYEKLEDLKASGEYQRETLIAINNNKSIRLKVIYANDFKWIFESLSQCSPDMAVSPKLIRALLARTYKLVNTDLPRHELPFNFETLQNITLNDDSLPKLYGISELNSGQALNANFNYRLTEVAEELGLTTWHRADDLLNKILEETKNNIKATDNKYHIAIKTGAKSVAHKYSQSLIALLTKVKNGEEYILEL